MKKRLAYNGCLLLCLLTSYAPALLPSQLWAISGAVSEVRSVSDFHAVLFAGPGKLVITQGPTETLTVVAEASLLSYVKSVVQAGVLALTFDQTNWRATPPGIEAIQWLLTVKKLDTLMLKGLGHVEAAKLKTMGLQISIVGQGEVQMADLEVIDLTCSVTGQGKLQLSRVKAAQASCVITEAGAIELAGQVTKQTVTITDQGDYQAGDLDSQTAKIGINGIGNITLWVRKRLDIEVFGKGVVDYYGHPALFECGLGKADIRSLGDK
jgi:hypothetical protein